MEDHKSKHEIRESSDYSIFKLKEDNRNILLNHVENLANQMKKIGFCPSKSIQIDSNYNIIDGQHRFLAAKSIGIPVLYIIDDSLDFILANKNRRGILAHDYIKYHAVNGNQDYIKLLEICKKNNVDVSRGCYLYSEKMANTTIIQSGNLKVINLTDDEISEMTKYYLAHDKFITDKKVKPRQLGNGRSVLYIFNVFYRSKMFRMEDFENNIHYLWKGLKWDNSIKHLIEEFLKIYNYKKSSSRITYYSLVRKNPSFFKVEKTRASNRD
jgi:hypothetical protein